MTSCTSNDELLWDYLHDLLDPAQVKELEQHLMSCPACHVALEAARVDCASLASAARLDGPFPLFEVPAPVSTPTLPLRPAWSPLTASRWAWVAAAAVLLVVALPFAGYRLGALQLSQTASLAEQQLLAARHDRDQFRERAVQEEKTAVEQLESKLVRLEVHGPADLQPDQTNLFHVNTTDFDGRPISARLTARVTREKGGPIIFERYLKGNGSVALAVPPLALEQGTKAQVEFLVDSSGGPERVREILEVSPAPRATFLTTQKQLYQSGEKVMFRSITLDRATRRPGSTPAAIQYQLVGPDTRVVATVSGTTQPEGIASGEFSLSSNAKPGIYTLTATDADGRFASVTHAFRVAGAQKLPAELAEVLFVPEGGSLVAGVPTRIYFDARDANQESIELEGTILDSKQREVGKIEKRATPAKPAAGRGFFVLTPKAGEAYILKPRNGVPHSLPRVQEVGLGLAIANPVIHPKEHIQATIYCPAGNKLTVVAGIVAHGQLLAQQTVALHAGPNAITVPAPATLAGVYRLALFPPDPGTTTPIAERLGFCHGERALPVAWETATRDGKPYLKIRSGAGTPEKSWFAVSLQPAYEAGAVEHASGQNLWSAMVLAPELPQGELERRRRSLWQGENTGALLGDEPAMAEALAIYLGLQSPVQHRQPPRDNRPTFASNPAPNLDSTSIAILNADNGDHVKAKYSAALASRAASLSLQDRELAAQEEVAQSRYDTARTELQTYEDRATALFQPLLGLLVVSLFSIGCIGLTVSIWRMVNSQQGARGWVLTASGALVACLVFVGLSPLKFVAPAAPRNLVPLAALQLKGAEPGTMVALAKQDPVIGHPVMTLQTGARPVVDRSKTLTAKSAQPDSLWLPSVASADGSCEVALPVSGGNSRRVLHVDVFTASGKIGSATALLK
jgi:hypothetical protein